MSNKTRRVSLTSVTCNDTDDEATSAVADAASSPLLPCRCDQRGFGLSERAVQRFGVASSCAG
jgi:hypothetical protein